MKKAKRQVLKRDVKKFLFSGVFAVAGLCVLAVIIYTLTKSKLPFKSRANEQETQCQVSQNVYWNINYCEGGFCCCTAQPGDVIQYQRLIEGNSCPGMEASKKGIQENQGNKTEQTKTEVSSVTKNELKLMLLGDSLIGGGGVPQMLSNRLKTEFPNKNFEFVGSQSMGGIRHEGHGSFSTSHIARDLEDEEWNELGSGEKTPVQLNSYAPDVVILQAGTNDIASGRGYDKLSYEKIFNVLRGVNPNVKIIVSKVPSLFDTANWKPFFSDETTNYNLSLQKDMESLSTPQSPVFVTEFPNFGKEDMSIDGVHPFTGGQEKLVSVYVHSLRSLFGNEQQL